MKNKKYNVGVGFGLTSGVITTLGLMIGLYSSTFSRGVVLAGILTIAVADSFSDALGIHISEESIGTKTQREIWIATGLTFFTKFVVTLSFLVPFIFFSLMWGIVASIIWGFFLISSFSYVVATKQNNNPYKAVLEHVMIMVFVIVATYYIGRWIDSVFLL